MNEVNPNCFETGKNPQLNWISYLSSEKVIITVYIIFSLETSHELGF